jgi:hypothetical protein
MADQPRRDPLERLAGAADAVEEVGDATIADLCKAVYEHVLEPVADLAADAAELVLGILSKLD